MGNGLGVVAFVGAAWLFGIGWRGRVVGRGGQFLRGIMVGAYGSAV